MASNTNELCVGKSAEEQTAEIADRFFGMIDDSLACAEGPRPLAYFMDSAYLNDPSFDTHEDVRTSLVDGVIWMAGLPESMCKVENEPRNLDETTILVSLKSENQLVERLQRDKNGVV